MTPTRTAAESFTETAAAIAATSGCTAREAVDYLMSKLLAERPALARKVIVSGARAAGLTA